MECFVNDVDLGNFKNLNNPDNAIKVDETISFHTLVKKNRDPFLNQNLKETKRKTSKLSTINKAEEDTSGFETIYCNKGLFGFIFFLQNNQLSALSCASQISLSSERIKSQPNKSTLCE
ncbi:CLUMA_CG012708, isoform A [Clunio marinus]|uniref:CLUMA_CG012708, isoform A n=1 Tax=Clunio marinus TaxID=568069 RepID=A0A1J1IGP0_9DIPT|nr:CLUMA_CG012708, isoform A [Clunio marinus]